MAALSTADVLDVWERALPRSPAARAALLLSMHDDGADEDISIGARDGRLLDLRRRLFGSSVDGECPCPACGERMELHFDVADICVPPPDDAPALAVAVDGWEVDFRLVTGADVDAAAAAPDSRLELVRRCVESARRDGAESDAADLPPAVVDAVAQRMAEADPQADVSLSLTCEACGHQWEVPFDAGAFLWEELTQWAVRTLDDVAQLAAAYGWAEADILRLSPWRRQRYLAGLGAGR